MSFLRHRQIYQSDVLFWLRPGRSCSSASPWAHRLDESATGYSLVSCTPAELTSASPGISMVNPIAGIVNHHLARAGEFSTGDLGNFQPELTASGLH